MVKDRTENPSQPLPMSFPFRHTKEMEEQITEELTIREGGSKVPGE